MKTPSDADKLEFFEIYLKTNIIDEKFNLWQIHMFCNGFFKEYESTFGRRDSDICLYECLKKTGFPNIILHADYKTLYLESIPRAIHTSLLNWLKRINDEITEKYLEVATKYLETTTKDLEIVTKDLDSLDYENLEISKDDEKHLLRILSDSYEEKEKYNTEAIFGYLGSLLLCGPFEIISICSCHLSKLRKSHLLVCLDDTGEESTNRLTCDEFILMLGKLPKYLFLDCRKYPNYTINDSLRNTWEQSHCSLILTNQDKNTWKEKIFDSLEKTMLDLSAFTAVILTRTMQGMLENALVYNNAETQDAIAYDLFNQGNYILAHKYYKMAAANHNRPAVLQLARMYEDGTGCIQSYERANYWLRSIIYDDIKN